MRSLLMLVLIALTTVNTQLSGMWIPPAVASVLVYVGQMVFPYFLAAKLATKDTTTNNVTVNSSPGAVVTTYNNCTFNNSQANAGNLGSEALAKLSEKVQVVLQSASDKKHIIQYVMVSLIGGTYVYTNFVLYQLADQLHAPLCWALWKQDLTLEQLKETPRAELINAMKQDCKERYSLAQEWQLSDFIIRGIDEEYAAIENYESVVYYIDCVLVPEQLIMARFRDAAVGLSGHNEQASENINTAFSYLTARKLFMIDDILLTQCCVRKERLSFLKSILETKEAEL